MKNPRLLPVALFMSGLLSASAANAQTAATWSFNNTTAATVGGGEHLTASNVTIGSDIGSMAFNGSTDFYGQDGWPTTTTIDANAYFQFTLTANANYYLVLNTISLALRRSTTGTAAGSGPQNWILSSSLDGYTSVISSGALTLSYQTFTVTLPATFQSIGSTVTFRLYGYNSVTTSGGLNRFVMDNITVSGQTPATTLAIQSLDLTGTVAAAGAVDLQWQASGFADGTNYIIQRSVDGTNFTDIGQLTSAGATAFQYRDASAPAVSTVFYRIMAQQPDGSSAWSPVITINLSSATGQTGIRSVATEGEDLRALLHFAATGTYQLNIWSTDGKMLYRQVLQEQAGDPAEDISFGTHAHGIYILTLSGAGTRTSREFMY
jgi:hypothetical protein